MLTSPGPKEGKTTVASNLALALADIHRPALFVDADLRKGRLHEIFQLPNDWGLSDMLAGKKPPEAVQEMVFGTGCQQLYLLPAGSNTQHRRLALFAAGTGGSERMRGRFEWS